MKPHIESLLLQALEPLLKGSGVPAPESLTIDATKDEKHGDFACNVALTLAKPLKQPPRKIAEALVENLPESPQVAKVEIAGPGFINFFLSPAAFQEVVPRILAEKEAFGRGPKDKARVMVEFVSANPTGPLHVGHGRNAAYGDSLANILDAAGYEVFREYYVNDAGRQVDVLAVSVWLRYLELCGEDVHFPARGYPADYVRESAAAFREQHGDALKRSAAEVGESLPVEAEDGDDAKAGQEAYLDALIARAKTLLGDGFGTITDFALDAQLARIRATLDAFGVKFDRWYSERELVRGGAVKLALKKLKESGRTYEKEGALWLKTEDAGDEKDRVLIKADGAATYFCNDLAYHVDKLERGYETLLDVWGADHHGYIARMRAAIEALTGRPDALKVQLMQFVTLSSGRMGKRSGNFVTLGDLIAEAGRDETRFFYLLRSHDQHLEFDIELARSKTNENPVYYVQYGCARVASVFRQAEERGMAWDESSSAATLDRLTEPHEKAVLVQLNRYPEMLQNAAAQQAPHAVAFYLRDLADSFHGWYNAHQFLVDDVELRNARLSLVAAVGQVLRNGLALLGVSAPDKM